MICASFRLIPVAFLAAVAAHRQQLDERKPCWNADKDPGNIPCYSQPEQVHLSYAGPNSLWVTWVTFNDTGDSLVKYGINKLDTESRGNADLFEAPGPEKKVRYDHRARLDNLQPGKRYSYRVGSQAGWSATYSFVALAPRSEGGFKFAFYGDMGSSNARSLGKIQQEAQDGDIDMILHVGDFAYDMDMDNGDMGDEFMRQIEPAAAYVPYMTVAGNHERNYDFLHYANRFTMPGNSENQFYSFDLGHAHFIGFSTEFYFADGSGFLGKGLPYLKNLTEQWNWLKNDLQEANRNRDSVPWIIAMGHRPMYCANITVGQDCEKPEGVMRTGIGGQYGLEELFYEHGVDLQLWGHEHTYQRLYPIYNRTVFNGTERPYEDPPAPVHIIAGSPGCRELTDRFTNDSPWFAFKSAGYGFGHIHVLNKTHVHIVQKDAGNETDVDDFMLVKHSHGPYTTDDRKRLEEFGTYIEPK